MLVAEGHGLRLAHTGIGNVRRALDLHRDQSQRSQHEDRAKNRGPGEGVGAAMKNLRHAYVRFLQSTNEIGRSPVYGSVMVTTRKNTHRFFRVSCEDPKL